MYVDRDTREVRYGNRTQSIRHVVGEWGWDVGEGDGDEEEEEGREEEGGGVTLNGVEGAVVKFREDEGGWEVLWEEDGGGRVEGGLTVSLERRWVGDDNEGEGDGDGEGKEGKREETGGKLEVRTYNATSTTSSKGKKRTGAEGDG